MHATLPLLQAIEFPALHRGKLETLQVNLGYRCNQACLHCHVNAGPRRKDLMVDEVIELIPQVLAVRQIETLDLTGSAPELHHNFRDLVSKATALGVHVVDRCNLTILIEPGQNGLGEFWPVTRWRWWHRCHVIPPPMWTNNAERACSIKASRRPSNLTRWVMDTKAAGSL